MGSLHDVVIKANVPYISWSTQQKDDIPHKQKVFSLDANRDEIPLHNSSIKNNAVCPYDNQIMSLPHVSLMFSAKRT